MKAKQIVLQQYPSAYVSVWRGRFRIVHDEKEQLRPSSLCSLFHTRAEAWRQAALNITIRRRIEASRRYQHE